MHLNYMTDEREERRIFIGGRKDLFKAMNKYETLAVLTTNECDCTRGTHQINIMLQASKRGRYTSRNTTL